jgi:hypothetical protein
MKRTLKTLFRTLGDTGVSVDAMLTRLASGKRMRNRKRSRIKDRLSKTIHRYYKWLVDKKEESESEGGRLKAQEKDVAVHVSIIF